VPNATILIERTGGVLAERVWRARSGKERRRGLLDLPPLAEGDALIIERAPQVHTFGMSYRIDVAFCSKDFVVVHIVRDMKPRRITRWVPRARIAIELRAGAARDVVVGDRLVVD